MTAINSTRLDELEEKVRSGLVHQPAGVDRLNRHVFFDQDVFDLEMKYIFEKDWVFLAHESQLPKPHDFITTFIGLQPVVLARNKSGDLHCFANACAHRGARVCRLKQGNRRNFTCTFHGWVYSNSGELIGVSAEQDGAYPAAFDKKKMTLPQARIEVHNGFIFGTFGRDNATLYERHKGALAFIDMLVDQSIDGKFEVVPGSTTYTYNGNWKLAIENGLDGYHAPYVHESFVAIAKRRAQRDQSQVRSVDLSKVATVEGGCFHFGGGSAAVWTTYSNTEDRPNFKLRDRFIEKYGPERARWMLEKQRNLLIFPNLLLSDSASTQIRIVRPVTVDKTEVATYCIAPVGEAPELREHRIRQYEDFYNASGIATPDDLAEFNNCQLGFGARAAQWSDLSRGATERISAAEGWEWAPGIEALEAAHDTSNEGHLVRVHQDWQNMMLAAIESERKAES